MSEGVARASSLSGMSGMSVTTPVSWLILGSGSCSAWVIIVNGTAGLYYISQACASQTSVYKEEISNTFSPAWMGLNKGSLMTCQPVCIVDPGIASIMSVYLPPRATLWDDKQKYYTLKDEAHDTMTESMLRFKKPRKTRSYTITSAL